MFRLFLVGALFCGVAMAPLRADQQGGGDRVDYAQLKIKSYRHWDLYLHENQCYLGRVFVLLREDEQAEDFLAIEGEAREEFFQIGREVKAALKALFQPDKMNYAALSNTSSAIHVHLIPRYREERVFEGIVFKDARWGQNYAPYDRSFAIEEAVLFKIKELLLETLH